MASEPSEKTDRVVATRGLKRTIEIAVRADGTSPALAFLEALTTTDQIKLMTLFQRLADHGVIQDGTKFKRLKGEIWEFKIRTRDTGLRVACFADKTAWVLTHGFLKKEDSTPPAEITLAERIRAEDCSRKKLSKAD